MKKSFKLCMSIMTIIVIALLLSIPITFMFDSNANASQDGADKANVNASYTDEAGEDYIFVVLEDEDVPLAAAPTIVANNHYLIYIITGLALFSLIAVSYTSWYSMVRKHINNFSYLIPKAELNAMIPANSFIHPRLLSIAEHEVVYIAANKYV